ncbi:Ubiquitin conjugation factor E4 [Vermiconidia calcicola]|uniref:Ubiquitin conjugation factor E4 n=1 Tax=Vermiconidia calcicola TaxID=1690605 RepID=A0ACC3NC97_9PEZI|nr:Ubiquitin conjugation factor E4 [Vermiconidia calcicola]
MADSTMSDADKIRMKRLAKLGGNSTSSPSTPNGEASTPTPAQPDASTAAASSAKPETSSTNGQNPFSQLSMNNEQEQEKKAAPQIKVPPRPASPAKRERDGSERPRSRTAERPAENIETWQDRNLRQILRATLKPEEVRDAHGHQLLFLASTRQDLVDASAPLQLNIEVLEGAITEAAGQAPDDKPFEYLLQCFKRVSRTIRGSRYSGPEDPKHAILKETRRLCMSYCIFAVTMPEMFGENVPTSNGLVDHLLADPDCETGIDTDFLTEASSRFEEDETIKEAIVGAAEELSKQLAQMTMLHDTNNYIRGFRNLLRFPKIVDAVTQSSMWMPESIEPQDIETKTLLGPFFRLSPMQLEVAQSYFSSPKTRDRGFIANAQNAVRMTLRTHQAELFQMADTIVRSGPAQRERILNWFALCVNKNHKKRAMRVDYKTVSSDGFMVNITTVLDQLCEPFMDARFSKIDRIDVNYLRRNPRVDISDETKINADQKQADEFYANKADGTSNFISEIFFLTVAAHHYGTEAAQTRTATMQKSAKRMEKDLEQFEADRAKYANDPRYAQRFEEALTKMKKQIDDSWSTIHATHGALLDDLTQARSMQFMRYVIVWLLRLGSHQDLPKEQLRLPLPEEQPDVFRFLPEYFLEDITDNFKFITGNIPHILTPQQCEEIVQVCITFLRNSEYVKNPGVKSGLVTILFYGVQQFHNRPKGVLGDLLLGSEFANKHLLHALMKFYIEAESTGSHTQFFDKFNIRFEIFQVIKCIWSNTRYRENLAKEARVNTDFFVQFVNMLVNDVTFVLDESLSAFVKIHDLTKEVENPTFMASLNDEEKKEKTELLDDFKGRAKSYMQLTRETMEMLILFSESLADSFTMPEIVTRLADMLDYNLDSMVGPKSTSLIVQNPKEYGFNPTALLADILSVYCNLSGKDNFIHAIARDQRSYKPSNFARATEIMERKSYKSPQELHTWAQLGMAVAEAKAAEEEEEQDLGEVPDEFMDPLVYDLMKDPVILPASKAVMDRSTIRSHLLSDPTDPFNRAPLKIEDVISDVELKGRIEAWKAERKAAKAAERAGGGEKMDTSEG